MIVVPTLTATLMVYQEAGKNGIAALWRIFDIDRVKNVRWVAIALLTMPAASLASFALMKIMDDPLPAQLSFNAAGVAVAFVLYFGGAALEEVGWTGYATEPLQQRFGVLNSSIIIGAVWAAWHIIPWAFVQSHTPLWVLGQTALTVLMRIVMGRIYVNGGKSLFLATLFHAAINTSYSAFPNDGSHYDPAMLCAVLGSGMLATAAVRSVRYR
jgi:membrane protease YdiL (CAAX protease family)